MRILVVDDEESGRAYLRALFHGHGHDVIEASDGAEALRLAQANPPDIAISDILMPVMDGYRLCLEWRKDATLKDIPFVFYTASYTDAADQNLADSIGADRFILKPADPTAIMDALEEVVETGARSRPEPGELAMEHAEAATLKEYSERLVSKLEEKVVELEESNRELRLAQELLSQEMEAKNDLIGELNADIVLREKVEAELRRERDFTSQVIEVAELAIVGTDLDGRIDLFSAGAEKITGVSTHDALGTDWYERFIPPAAREYHRAHAARLSESRDPLRMTGAVLTSSGAERILDWSDTVRVGDDGELNGVIGFGLDVTERVRRDVSERVVARLTNAVLFEETIDDAVFEFCARLAQTLRLLYVGVVMTPEADEPAVRGVGGLLAGDTTDPGVTALEAVKAAATAAVERAEPVTMSAEDLHAVGADADVAGAGLAIPLTAFGDTSGALVFLAERPHTFDAGLISVLQTTAERLALVLLLSENQQRLRLQSAALEAAASAIVIVDVDGLLAWANPAYEVLTGRSIADDRGKRLDILRKGQGRSARAGLVKALNEGRALLAEIDSVHQDGTPFEELVYMDPVRDRKGDVTHFVVVRQDITERKRLEQLKSDFLSMVSHELRTPLTRIIGFTDLLMRESGEGRVEAGQRFVEEIKSHSSEMQGLVEELLEVSQMQAEPALPLRLEECDLADVVRRAAKSAVQEEPHELELSIGDGAGTVMCDSDKVAHIVKNLVTNAAKYSPEGGPVHVRLDVSDDFVRVSVSDSGVGIEEADLSRIFERFTQVDMTSSREFGGFGLGLFIVKTLVDAHGGTVDVESEVGKGSTFTVELPLRGPQPTGDEAGR